MADEGEMKIYVINVERHLSHEETDKAERHFSQKLSALGVADPKVLILPPGYRFSIENS